MISGHITVCKVYKNGTSETVLDRSNMITAGLGSSFLDIQQQEGSTYPPDYRPYYFQMGTDVIGVDSDLSPSSFFYQVCAPFNWSDYGSNSDLIVEKKYRGFNASTEDSRTYTELLMTSALLSSVIFSGSDEYFASITPGQTTKWFMDSFESEIVLDEHSGNDKTISEVGLFAKNPKGLKGDAPLLMAYKSFTGIPKTAEFSIVIHWVIGFLGLSTTTDTFFKGGSGPQDSQVDSKLYSGQGIPSSPTFKGKY